MEKLKTLKDLEGNILYKWQRSGFVEADKIRQEAIKWIKEISHLDSSEIGCYAPDGFTITHYCDINIKKWIKKFFNITEEDLK